MFTKGSDCSIAKLVFAAHSWGSRHLIPANLRQLQLGLSNQLAQLRPINELVRGMREAAARRA